MSAIASLQGQLEGIKTTKTPLKQLNRLVELAANKFAWGLDSLGALIGTEAKRSLGVELAQLNTSGGSKPEILELIDAKNNLEAAKSKSTPDPREIDKCEKAVAEEAADVITMTLAWIAKLGVKGDRLDTAIKKNCGKFADRFLNITKFAEMGKVTLDELKSDPKLFNFLWCAVKNHCKDLDSKPYLFEKLWEMKEKSYEKFKDSPEALFKEFWAAQSAH